MKECTEAVKWFGQRLMQLRWQKGVSARDMSLSLGQGASYINKIENHWGLPSLQGFFNICEYLGVTPEEFFDSGSAAPQTVRQISEAAKKLSPDQAQLVLRLMEELTRGR